MRRIKAAESRAGAPRAARSLITVTGRRPPLARAAVVRAVETVLAGERRRADVSITFLGPVRMRRLNAEWKRRDRLTDVLAFSLASPGSPRQGDVYVCRAMALISARARKIPLREELLRLVIHGTLHVLGHDHPEGEDRTRSVMWRKQEKYLACLG
jgi:probable rRNA maturation factor